MVKAVIFDFDGTICDTIPDAALAVNLTRARLGFPEIDLERVREVAYMSTEPFMRALLPEEFPDSMIPSAADIFSEFYEEHSCDKSRLYEGIPELLARLKESGIKLALMSNKRNDLLRKIVDKLLPDTFDHVWGTVEWMPVKPDPTRAKFIAFDCGCKPHEMAFVGDSTSDIQTGQNAGMRPIAVGWGYEPVESLAKANPSAVAMNLDELEALLTEDPRVAQASKLLNERGLLEILAKFGEPRPVGSYIMDMMCRNQLDVVVSNENAGLDELYALTSAVQSAFRPTKYAMKYEMSPDGIPDRRFGFTCELDGEDWEVDVRFCNAEGAYKSEDFCLNMKLMLANSPEKKSAVRAIKRELCARGLLGAGKYAAIQVYEAVIKRDILTLDEFLEAFKL